MALKLADDVCGVESPWQNVLGLWFGKECSLRLPCPDSWFSTGLNSRTYFLGSLGRGYPRETRAVRTCLGPCQCWTVKMQCHLTKHELALVLWEAAPPGDMQTGSVQKKRSADSCKSGIVPGCGSPGLGIPLGLLGQTLTQHSRESESWDTSPNSLHTLQHVAWTSRQCLNSPKATEFLKYSSKPSINSLLSKSEWAHSFQLGKCLFVVPYIN